VGAYDLWSYAPTDTQTLANRIAVQNMKRHILTIYGVSYSGSLIIVRVIAGLQQQHPRWYNTIQLAEINRSVLLHRQGCGQGCSLTSLFNMGHTYQKSLQGLTKAGADWLQPIRAYLLVGWRFLQWRLWLWLQSLSGQESVYMKRTLLFIRHGQTTWNVENRLPGQLPGVPLTDQGRQQAARLAEALTVLPISAIISSPLERARETAEYIAQGRGLTIQFEADLMDTDVGNWAGKVIKDLNQSDPTWKDYVKNPAVAPEGVETFPQVQRRVVAAVERWCSQDNIGAYPAFVAHADVIKLLVAYYMDLAPERAGSLMIDNASVSMVELDQEIRPRVFAIGWSPRPGWLKPPTPEQPAKEATTEAGATSTEKEEKAAQNVGEQKM
jgi:broad specificity phosphatase PhoE